MVRVSSPAKLRPWSELTAKMVMGVVPGLVIYLYSQGKTDHKKANFSKVCRVGGARSWWIHVTLRVRPPDIEWERAEIRKRQKFAKKVENGPQPDMGKKWPKNSK